MCIIVFCVTWYIWYGSEINLKTKQNIELPIVFVNSVMTQFSFNRLGQICGCLNTLMKTIKLEIETEKFSCFKKSQHKFYHYRHNKLYDYADFEASTPLDSLFLPPFINPCSFATICATVYNDKSLHIK